MAPACLFQIAPSLRQEGFIGRLDELSCGSCTKSPSRLSSANPWMVHVRVVETLAYRLVKNGEALKLGEQCFRQVFSAPTADGMEIFNIIQPSTCSFCHVDFLHKGRTLEPWQGDRWWPYLRMTNSYNRTKPLRFDLGFCRGICTNGVIFGREQIVFRYYHTREQIDVEGKFQVDATRLKKLETVFLEQMHGLFRARGAHAGAGLQGVRYRSD